MVLMSEVFQYECNSEYDEMEFFNEEELVCSDDELDPLMRIEKNKCSGSKLLRLRLVRDFADLSAHLGGNLTVLHIVPLFNEMKNENEEMILKALLEQSVDVAMYLSDFNGGEYYDCILKQIFPFVVECMMDIKNEVRETSFKVLNEFGKILINEDLSSYLLPIVRRMVFDESNCHHMTASAQLLDFMAPIFGKAGSISRIVPLWKLLVANKNSRVRMAAVSNMGKLCQTIGPEETINHLLPSYMELCDDKAWTVCKACVEALVVLSENVDYSCRYTELVEAFTILSRNPCRWVRSAIFQILGRFIYTFKGHRVPEDLLSDFYLMSCNVEDGDCALYCAFSIPAILDAVGIDEWDKISHIYFKLRSNNQVQLRKSLSYSLHAMAKILGTEITEKDLLDTFEYFLSDLDEVKIGILKNFSSFISVLSPSKRLEYIKKYENLIHSSSWRIRKLMTKQLGHMIELFDPDVIISYIVPIFLRLIQEKISAIRQTAVKLFPLLERNLRFNPTEYDKFLNSIVYFSKSSNYQLRQVFALMCLYSIESLDQRGLESTILPHLIELASDRVSNVRIIVAEIVKQLDCLDHPLRDREWLFKIRNSLMNDPDPEVVYIISGVFPKSITRKNLEIHEKKK